MRSRLIAFAMDFSSFLVQKTKHLGEVRNIVLFGSVARGDESVDSDVDIFIDTISDKRAVKTDIEKCLDSFIQSSKYNNYWGLLGVNNEIKLTIGDLSKWDIRPSIIANGITLYGKYKELIKEGQHRAIFVWENVKPNSKRVLFNKQLFGFKDGKKHYNGIIQKYHGERLGKGCISVPIEQSNIFHGLFKKYRISVKIKKFLEY
ncbi:MAG TPA: nucleotidyltransferase domain-containing protein [Candidatus Nanoarchaeia archaeon]|nr:nucleotidyltransferase domain-containing protein [Candidatus Nanoarchaeia archaeon]